MQPVNSSMDSVSVKLDFKFCILYLFIYFMFEDMLAVR